DRIAGLVTAEKRAGDVAVASIHWGANWGFDVPAEHRRFAHQLIERAGIDVVHGHSSHHAKGIEVHRGRPIFYGCGDFLNDYEGIHGPKDYRDDLTLMYFPSLDARTGNLMSLEMVPLRIRNFQLHRPSDAECAWLRDTMARECRRFGHNVAATDHVLCLEWD
ncbi:MAG TPA: CapA family protein, partial [Gemmatimonadaceae bacterium]|nr:CapA family protein [Gemmatimonadaceae bacterium]